jgi:branched-chain amino acid transport system permease protein
MHRWSGGSAAVGSAFLLSAGSSLEVPNTRHGSSLSQRCSSSVELAPLPAFAAPRDNERASAAAGVHLVRVRLTVFAIAGALAALGGVLLGFQSGTMPYNRLDALSSLFMVAVAFVGGIASVRGALLAGLLAPGGVLSVAVSQLTTRAEIQTLITGALLLVVVIRWPNGLAGLVKPPTRLARPA